MMLVGVDSPTCNLQLVTCHSYEHGQLFRDSPEFELVEMLRFIAHRTGVQRRGLAGRCDHKYKQGQTEGLEFLDQLLAILVPRQQHADATAHGGGVVEHEAFERFK